MQNELKYLVYISQLDSRLDEFEEDLGDLPEQLKAIQQKFDNQLAMVKETEKILSDVRKFAINSKQALSELKDKEQKLSDRQFRVRNNKEFDAITKEIEHIRQEYNKITSEMRNISVKEDNLIQMLEMQKKDRFEIDKELKEKQKEFDAISSDQNEDIKKLKNKKKEFEKKINPHTLEEYNRIRGHLKDAVVLAKRNSCTGCYSAIPHQKIVMLRNNMDKLFFCETCGRILYPEELILEENYLY